MSACKNDNVDALVTEKLAEREHNRELLDKWTETNHALVPSASEQNAIAALSATAVLKKMRSGELTATAVMVTMCLRAKLCGQLHSCNADEMFLSGIEKAQEADKVYEEVGPDLVPSLHGLPITVKDHIWVKGSVSTSGLRSRCMNMKDKNAAIVSSLIEEGAIPFVKGNIPQLLLIPESVNDLWGRSLNPWNVNRTPGGSSGGEAALICSNAAFVGIGSDIGGSIRMPANFCGIAGFKPTPERVSSKYICATTDTEVSGQVAILASPGPMARRVEDLVLIAKTWWSPSSAMYKIDHQVPPVHFRSIEPKKRVRIGYFTHDGWFEVAPGSQRAVHEAKASLEKAGYELVPFTVPEGFVRLYFKLMGADGGFQNMKSGMTKDDVLLDEYSFLNKVANLSPFVRNMSAPVLRLMGQERKAQVVTFGAKSNTLEYWQTIAELKTYRNMFIERMHVDGLEALLCPGGTLPALPHGTSPDLIPSLSLTFLYNLLHWPAGTVPITVTREDECELEVLKKDEWNQKAQDALKDSEGLPIGVQIATLPWKDELCLHIMEDLEKATLFHEKVQMPGLKPHKK